MWSAAQYEKFKAERKQPGLDLIALVERRANMRAIDLGCGTGELTRELHESLDARETLGIDSANDMLRKASQLASGTLHFAHGDIETFETDDRYDLVFSNAALHWIPDHESLLTRLATLLTVDGQLAVQMPDNDSHLSHSTAAEVARDFGIAARPDYILPIARYAELLHRLGFPRQQVRMQVYGHTLPSPEDVIEWVRGALLTHYEALLGARYEQFLAAYRERLLSVLPDERPYFYTYKRILLWGSR